MSRPRGRPRVGELLAKPCLRLAILGFDDDARLRRFLRERCVLLPWEAASLDAADAVWICGASAAAAAGAGLVAVTDHADGGVTVVDLRTRGRPTFFSVPVVDAGIRASNTFDPDSLSSVEYAFRQAEAVLRPRAMELILAHQVAARLPELRAYRYELTRRGKLVAMIDMGGAVGVNPRLALDDLERASWEPLRHARGVPENFHGGAFAEIFARYLERVPADWLPTRYRRLTIHLRRGARPHPAALGPPHYAILHELAAKPQSFRELQSRIDLPDPLLARALAVLFYAGAITTDRGRAEGAEDATPFSRFDDAEA